jgi:iron complex outermembrane receptor protein
VVTKKNNQIFTSYGSHNTKKVGFSNFYDLDKYKLSFNGYYQDSNKAIVTSGDKGGNSGESNEEFDDYSVGINLQSENLTITSRLKNSNTGSFFGLSNYLEKTDDMDGFGIKSIFTKVSYQNQITKDINYNVSIGYNIYAQDIEARASPHPTKGDLIMKSNYEEKKYYTNLELFINSFKNQEIVLGFGYEKSKPTKNYFNSYYETTPNTQVIPSSNLLKSGISRDISSVYLNDTVNVSEKLDASVGVRVDNYSDFGNALSPRVAVVYRQNEKLNYKMVYSKAFRAPSFVELYADIPNVSVGNESLDKEESTTVEAGIIYDISTFDTLKLNIYDTKINNIIYRDTTKKYIQDGYQKFQGIETEYISQLTTNSKLNLTLSYITAKDQDNNDVVNVANFLGNIRYSNRFSNGLVSATILKHVGKRKRAAGDTRDDLDSYNTVDQSFSYLYKKYNITASIKNIFNESVYYPADANTYASDYPREGRTFGIKVSMEF